MDVMMLKGFSGFILHESFKDFDIDTDKLRESMRCGFEIEGSPRWNRDDASDEIIGFIKRVAGSMCMRAYHDYSVGVEVVTEPLSVDEIEPQLNFWLWLLDRCGIDTIPFVGAGCHMTVSIGALIPSFVKVNIEHLTIYFAPVLAALSWAYDHHWREKRYFELNNAWNNDGLSWLTSEDDGRLSMFGMSKYSFVHFKEFDNQSGIEFRYPDSSPNARHLWRVAIMNMALVLKALKISKEYKAIIRFKFNDDDRYMINHCNYAGEVEKLVMTVRDRIDEFLEFMQPEIEELLGNGGYHEWTIDLMDVEHRDVAVVLKHGCN